MDLCRQHHVAYNEVVKMLKRFALVGLVVMAVSLALLVNTRNHSQDIRPQASTTPDDCSEDRADINCDGRIDLIDCSLLLSELDL